MKYLSKGSILNVLILISALFFLFDCSGTKPTTKPTPIEQPTTEQPKKEVPVEKPPSKPETVTPTKPSPPPPSPTPKVTPTPPLRITQVTVPSENLRDKPQGKIIRKVGKGASLTILEVKEKWLHVRLEDETEGWIWKASTSEAPKPPPTAPTTPSKPTPM